MAPSRTYYHRSTTPLSVGTVLSGNGLPNNVKEIEEAFEQRRPSGCLSRLKSVFMTTEPASKLDGVHGDYVYRVQPSAPVQRHDNVWYGNVQGANLKEKYKGTSDEKYVARFQDWNAKTIKDNADAYWSSKASENPRWEYLSSEAEVKELIVAPNEGKKGTN
jgi:hypothetical protein